MLKTSPGRKTNEKLLKMANDYLHIIPTIKKRKITHLGHMIRRNNIHRLLLEGPLAGRISRTENGLDDKHQRLARNEIPKPCEIGSMENHDSPLS